MPINEKTGLGLSNNSSRVLHLLHSFGAILPKKIEHLGQTYLNISTLCVLIFNLIQTPQSQIHSIIFTRIV